jgi:hypothetical protein
MMQKRLKQLVIGGAVLAALALGGSVSAGAATDSSGPSSTTATLQASGGGLPALGSTRAPETAAHKGAETTVAAGATAKAGAAPLTVGRGGSVGAMHHVRDGWIRDLYLTDHEQYVRHHQRLASQA